MNTTHETQFSLIDDCGQITLSLFNKQLLFIHSDFISGQFCVKNTRFNLKEKLDHTELECRGDDGKTFYQTWKLKKGTLDILATYLHTIGANLTPLKELHTEESENQLQVTTQDEQIASFDITFLRLDIMIRMQTQFCTTLLNRDRVGILLNKQPKNAHLQFHLQRAHYSAYQGWFFKLSDASALQSYFRGMGFRMEDPLRATS